MTSGSYDADMQGNPIGELQEYTQKNLLRPPVYQFIGEQGPPHAREFVCTVKLAKLTETGTYTDTSMGGMHRQQTLNSPVLYDVPKPKVNWCTSEDKRIKYHNQPWHQRAIWSPHHR